MSTANRIDASIPGSVITDVTNKLKEAAILLKPYLESLTVEERKTLAKMSDKTVAFVNKIDSYTDSNPEFAPAYMEIPDFKKDINLVNDLKDVLDIANQICSNVDDTVMLAGSEAYVGALLYYYSLKGAIKAGQPNAKPIYEDLAKRFPGPRKKTPPTIGS